MKNSKNLTKKDIYKEWLKYNKTQSISISCLFITGAMMLLLVADQLLFGADASKYMFFRFALILFNVVVLFSLRNYRFNIDSPKFQRATSVISFTQSYSLILMYVYFYYMIDDQYYSAIVSANYMIVIGAYFMLRFFERESLALFLFNLPLLILTCYIDPRKDLMTVYSFIFWNIVCYGAAWYLRYLHKTNLARHYKVLLGRVTPKIALFSTVSEYEGDLNNIFPPKCLNTVCFSTDWRSFQKFCSNHSPEQVSEIIKRTHEVTIKIFLDNIGDNEYVIDWFGDQVFFGLFNEVGDDDALLEAARNIAQLFQTNLQIELRKKKLHHVPVMDLGISFGQGNVCFSEGPGDMLKSTIMGEVVGLAVRLETVAKTFRKKNKLTTRDPIISIDKRVLAAFDKLGMESFDTAMLDGKNHKDLEDETICLLLPRPQVAVKTEKKRA